MFSFTAFLKQSSNVSACLKLGFNSIRHWPQHNLIHSSQTKGCILNLDWHQLPSTAPITGYPNHMHHSSLISLTRMPALSSAHIKAKTHQTFSIDFQALFRNFENSWLKLTIIKLQLILFWCPLHWGSHHFSTKFTFKWTYT